MPEHTNFDCKSRLIGTLFTSNVSSKNTNRLRMCTLGVESPKELTVTMRGYRWPDSSTCQERKRDTQGYLEDNLGVTFRWTRRWFRWRSRAWTNPRAPSDRGPCGSRGTPWRCRGTSCSDCDSRPGSAYTWSWYVYSGPHDPAGNCRVPVASAWTASARTCMMT